VVFSPEQENIPQRLAVLMKHIQTCSVSSIAAMIIVSIPEPDRPVFLVIWLEALWIPATPRCNRNRKWHLRFTRAKCIFFSKPDAG
jgi:hypothetical protein